MEVRLRSSIIPYEVVDQAEAELGITGNARLSFNRTDTQPLYIEVVHRNSISTWSSSPVYFNGSYKFYNFTINSSMAYGGNMVLKGGRWCFYSGDVDQNSFVDGVDLSLVDNDAMNFQTGHLPTDINGDGTVDATDLSLVDNNAMNFIGVIRP
jgi:hypothetical protein